MDHTSEYCALAPLVLVTAACVGFAWLSWELSRDEPAQPKWRWGDAPRRPPRYVATVEFAEHACGFCAVAFLAGFAIANPVCA
jgi:hypothetical protein